MDAWAVVVGTVAGALAGGGVGLLTQHLRFRHDDRSRWLDLRRELAVRFLDATDDIYKWTRNLAAMHTAAQSGIELQFEGISNDVDVMQKLHEADEQARKLNTEIDLVGSEAERAAAARLRNAVWASEGEQAEEEAREARSAYQDTVRDALIPRSSIRSPLRPRMRIPFG